MYDVIVVGGGPAGLNSALVSGRQRRRVLLLDSGSPRNAPAEQMHMFLSRDGSSPAELRRIGREQLTAYPNVEVRDTLVADAAATSAGLTLTLADGSVVQSRKLVLATGQVDVLEEVEGLSALFGRGVYHCPFCHGWETGGLSLAVLGHELPQVMQALYVADRFSDDVVVLTNGRPVPEQAAARLAAAGISVDERPVARVEGEAGAVRLVLKDGDVVERQAVYHRAPTRQHSDLAERLGCTILPDGCVRVDEFQRTSVPGVFAAGDMARLEALPDALTFVITGAADGARAAVWLDQELFREDAGLGG
ncbi:NAD(P)/FAD-dependent oxidoreductase [Streptomyces sp. 549]|uniref:NAD(P)/FAD-dependent oxidoreductase n=1 Tax=Streptomyces sp. 549 TaxID=3049076 RepID=UPI0024C31454|nr:NAD(P)/FAD-dependent oxidoreductase [Streptomyces sp. 549]MDK1474491.1 NAD(P)/FAD-dependent oxidoreductase [Streptomyces sp. 549]